MSTGISRSPRSSRRNAGPAGAVVVFLWLASAIAAWPGGAVAEPGGAVAGQTQDLRLPNVATSVKFGVIGDSGTGDREQFQVADEMMKLHATFKFDRVIMMGDNIYGGQSASDLDKKFAQPYKALVDAGVKFYASLGNHDSQNNRNYAPFNMGGKRYYSMTTKNVRFVALDSDSLDPDQLAWLEGQLREATEQWKIVYFHHPLYSDGKTHGSDVNLRVVLEPLFVKYHVNVVFSGHDHIYERITPQKGIYYFVEGSSGQLRKGDLARSAMTAAGFDTDCTFMLVEIAGAQLSFVTMSRTGQVVDSGTIEVQKS
jgi:3',5'-cyclic AMP phosphodiesterase CpdA